MTIPSGFSMVSALSNITACFFGFLAGWSGSRMDIGLQSMPAGQQGVARHGDDAEKRARKHHRSQCASANRPFLYGEL
jgi:hypothetical protein